MKPGRDWVEVSRRVTRHAAGDDLLTAGLGLPGLRAAPPELAPDQPASLRRRAIHANYGGLVDLSPESGFGSAYARMPAVPGTEVHAFLRLPDRTQPFRVLVQIPDAFDRARPTLVVCPVSGSRGIYGGVPIAGTAALPRGMAVVCTDKGCGPGVYDADARTGVALDGRRVPADSEPVEFALPALASGLALKHAHSGEHPEADWARMVAAAVAFGREVVAEIAGVSPVRTLGLAISNGAGALLRAADAASGCAFDGIVAGAANVCTGDGPALFHYALEAALWLPLAAPKLAPLVGPWPDLGDPARARNWWQALRALDADLVGTWPGAVERAREALAAAGFDDDALCLAGLCLGLRLWPSLLATYTQAYLASDPAAPVFGIRFVADGKPDDHWWSDGTGIVPCRGMALGPPFAAGDPEREAAGLLAIRNAWLDSREALHGPLRAAVAATRCHATPACPVLLVHGAEDGLIPLALSSRRYLEHARAGGAEVALWRLPRAQHFDAFNGWPGLKGRQRPLLAALHAGLETLAARLDGAVRLVDRDDGEGGPGIPGR